MMLSKTLKTALAGLALSLALPMTQASARDLVVATDTAFVPFEFKQDGKYTGFDVQLWEAIAKQAGLSYKLHPMDFNGNIPGLHTRYVYVALPGNTICEDPATGCDF